MATPHRLGVLTPTPRSFACPASAWACAIASAPTSSTSEKMSVSMRREMGDTEVLSGRTVPASAFGAGRGDGRGEVPLGEEQDDERNHRCDDSRQEDGPVGDGMLA